MGQSPNQGAVPRSRALTAGRRYDPGLMTRNRYAGRRPRVETDLKHSL
jgi:hypothetical protein